MLVACDKPAEEIEEITITDVDGNVYDVVTIGEQVWMAENLKVTHYRDGTGIPNISDSTEWRNSTSGAYCAYDNDQSNVSTYGFLYNWYAIDDSRKLAPMGWHIPTIQEWQRLSDNIGNESGFTWSPGGYREDKKFFYIGKHAFLWSTSDYNDWAYIATMSNNDSLLDPGSLGLPMKCGLSVRCIKD